MLLHCPLSKNAGKDSWNAGLLPPAALFAPLSHAYRLKWSLLPKWFLLEWHFVHCGLRGEFPGWNHEFWPETPGQGTGFVEEFWGGKGNCFDWPSCYSTFESAGLFSWILFNRSRVLISNTRSPEVAESFLTAERGREPCVPELRFHSPVFMTRFNLLGWRSWQIQNEKMQ